MKYYVKRGLRRYRPSTFADLQQDVATGSLLPTDLARDETMADWVPLSQVLGKPVVSAPNYLSDSHGPNAYASMSPVPPNLHWGLVMILGMFTFSVFTIVWAVVQTVWVRRLNPASRALPWLLIAIGIGVIEKMLGLQAGTRNMADLIAPPAALAIFILICLAEGAMRRDLETYYNSTENIHLQLSGAMVFFFNVFYFQYHFSRIAKWKKTGVLPA